MARDLIIEEAMANLQQLKALKASAGAMVIAGEPVTGHEALEWLYGAEVTMQRAADDLEALLDQQHIV